MGERHLVFSYDRSLFALWQRTRELPAYHTFYDQHDFSAAYRQNGLSLGLHHSRVTGSEENLGSHRELFALEAGYTLSFWKIAFLTGSFLPGAAWRSANFGKGSPLETGLDINLKTKTALGLQYCPAPQICPAAFFAVAGEWSPFGAQPYSIYSASLGLSLAGTWESPKTKSPPAEKDPPAPEKPVPPSLVFSKDSSDLALTGEMKEKLRGFSLQLAQNPNKYYLIEGRSTLFPDPAKNRVEAYRIVLAIQSYLLVNLGVSPNQVRINAVPHSTEKIAEIVDVHGESIREGHLSLDSPANISVTFREVSP